MPDTEAIRRLKQGDIGGLETLIARYQLKAIRAAYFVVQDEQAAEDIVQDAFLSMYHHCQGFDERRPFEPYLMRTVLNAALNHARRRAWEVTLEEPGDGEHLEALLSESASVENQVEAEEVKEAILSAIRRLPPRQRAAIVQRYYLAMGEEEMSAQLGAAPGTVKWLLNAARTRLRALLGSQRSVK